MGDLHLSVNLVLPVWPGRKVPSQAAVPLSIIIINNSGIAAPRNESTSLTLYTFGPGGPTGETGFETTHAHVPLHSMGQLMMVNKGRLSSVALHAVELSTDDKTSRLMLGSTWGQGQHEHCHPQREDI